MLKSLQIPTWAMVATDAIKYRRNKVLRSDQRQISLVTGVGAHDCRFNSVEQHKTILD